MTALHTVLSIQCYPSPLSLYPAAAQGSDQIFLLNGHNLSSHLFENNSTLFRAQLLNLPGCRGPPLTLTSNLFYYTMAPFPGPPLRS